MRIVLAVVLMLTASIAQARAFDPLPSLPLDAARLVQSVESVMQAQGALTLRVPGGRQISFTTRIERYAPGIEGLVGYSSGSDALWLYRANGRLAGEIFASGGH